MNLGGLQKRLCAHERAGLLCRAMQPHMGVITAVCLSELTGGTDCTAEWEGEEEDEEEKEEVEEEEHQLTLAAATVGWK